MSRPAGTLEGKCIAFFHQSAELYGSDRVLLDLACTVQAEGGTAVVLLPYSGPLTEAFAQRGIAFHVLPVVKLTRAHLSIQGLFQLAGEALTCLGRYDRIFSGRTVHLVHSNTLAVLGGALWAKRRHLAHLWHVHEIMVSPRIAAYGFPRLVNALADHVVCNSNATLAWMHSVQPRLGAKMRVIWNGVPAPVVNDSSAVAQLRLQYRPQGVRLAVGLLGRINRLKGHDVLIDAAELLHHQGVRDFSLVLIGSPPPGQDTFLQQLQQRIRQSPLRERIVLQDFTANVWPSYAALDIVCVPSTEPESFGLVAAEAMAAARPVIASNIGALGEIVEDGATGFTVPPRDAQALAASLLTLLNSEALRQQMGLSGAHRMQSQFSMRRMKERLLRCYAEALSNGHRP